MNVLQLTTSIKKEIWEYQRIFLWVPVIIAAFIIMTPILAHLLSNNPQLFNTDFMRELANIQGGENTAKNEFVNKVLVAIKPEKVTTLLNQNYIRLVDLTPEPGKPEHDLSRNMHRSTMAFTKYNGGRKYDGSGVVVVDNDDGIVGPHIDFTGRMTQPGVTGTSGTHGDMTTGIVGGAGNIDPTIVGMAPGASLYVRQYSSSLPNTVSLHNSDSIQKSLQELARITRNFSSHNFSNALESNLKSTISDPPVDFFVQSDKDFEGVYKNYKNFHNRIQYKMDYCLYKNRKDYYFFQILHKDCIHNNC